MGCVKVTVQNLEVVRVDAEQNLLLVKGAVPGPKKAMEIIISFGSDFSKTATTMGIRIPKVPQLVPVEKARKQPTRKMMAGSRFIRPPAAFSIAAATKAAAPRLSVIAFSVHAKVSIRMAGTIALKPFGRHAMQSVKPSTLRTQ